MTFPQGTVLDGLSNVPTTGSTTRIRIPRPGENASSRNTKTDGHLTTLGFAYANEVAREAFRVSPLNFPTGSVIVRERLLSPSVAADQLVVMIKHERDFNPKANGWEFLTVSGDGKKILKREQDGQCLKCHASASNNDFVFPEDGRYR